MILLVDYEPRTVARVREALASLGLPIVVANDLDAAVNACATAEPRVVLITSMLPRVTAEDAITQLRARAGLRNTPFLVMASGYSGQSPAADAAALGAQDILAKPFSNDDLGTRTRSLLAMPRQAQPSGQEPRATVLDSLRQGKGDVDFRTVTSEELFGDLFVEEEEKPLAATQRIKVQPIPKRESLDSGGGVPESPKDGRPESPPRAEAERAASASEQSDSIDSTLAELSRRPSTKVGPSPASSRSVDDLLSQTLSGLEVKLSSTPSAAPAPPPPTATRQPVAETPVAETPVAEEPADEPLPGGTPFGQYELIDVIATGGMAEVYKARMRGVEGFQKIVAIKRILGHLTDNDEFVTMFIDEAKLAAQLQHPNIIHIYDLGKIEKSYYIAMEFIHGKDLRSIMRKAQEKKRRLPMPLAVFIASRLAAALDYAHRKRDLQGSAMSLVHRDVSPQNVLISYDGDIKLCDFGIAKAASKASHTRAGALKGKLQYMSPEQAWGKDLDHRSDIFSLGLVLYEMITGAKAFAGDSELSVLEQVRSPSLTAPRELDPAIPEELENVVMKALKESRDDRYQTASAMASDLDSVLATVRPAPGAAELGAFLSRLEAGEGVDEDTVVEPEEYTPEQSTAERAKRARHERPMTAATPERHAAPRKPADAAPMPAPAPSEPVASWDTPAEGSPKKSFPTALVAVAAVAVIAVAAWLVFGRTRGPATPPGEPTAATTALNEGPAAPPETEGGGGSEPDAATVLPAVAVPIPTPAPTAPQRQTAAAIVPTAVATAVPTPAPSPEPAAAAPATVIPTVATTAVPTPVPPTPTPAPTRPQATPTPAIAEGDFVEFPDVPPEPITMPKATYPIMAQRRRLGGIVILRALVDHTGQVEQVEVLRGASPDLGMNDAAAAALRNWRFRPATKNGVRVKTWYNNTITFQP